MSTQPNDALVAFSWTVASGYRWEDFPAGSRGREQGKRLLCANPGPARVYQPLVDAPGLFLELAQLKTSEEAVLAFASHRGLLGLVPGLEAELAGEATDSPDPETLSEWQREVRNLRQGVDVAAATVAGNEEALRAWFRVKKDGSATFRYRQPGERLVTHGSVEPGTLVRGDVERAARLLVLRITNSVLKQHASPQLLFDADSGDAELHVVPENLLGVAWVQLAQYVEGGRDFRRCDVCRAWFLASPDGRTSRRADALYCSDRCRVRAYRERQERARALYAGGMRPSAIARELKSNTDTVRGWIGLPPHGGRRR